MNYNYPNYTLYYSGASGSTQNKSGWMINFEIINVIHSNYLVKVELMRDQDPKSSPSLHEDFQPTQ
jgi:hypothetical protein